ncbi:hypothetical protein [Chryseolinea lacunae]|uniref:Uncharacterized protein n=1 Tax=Chryseolinea lacunae TaxID=2801331 RepID=A0ABS1KX41_9BACT|nr:hypothetical protein [Chryseolinea lacunae]MBL0743900.1 hypothetical protein [Chryseolinea lacunae]
MNKPASKNPSVKANKKRFMSKEDANRYLNDPYVLKKAEETKKYLQNFDWDAFMKL